jgi:hypothetical protein
MFLMSYVRKDCQMRQKPITHISVTHHGSSTDTRTLLRNYVMPCFTLLNPETLDWTFTTKTDRCVICVVTPWSLIDQFLISLSIICRPTSPVMVPFYVPGTSCFHVRLNVLLWARRRHVSWERSWRLLNWTAARASEWISCIGFTAGNHIFFSISFWTGNSQRNTHFYIITRIKITFTHLRVHGAA